MRAEFIIFYHVAHIISLIVLAFALLIMWRRRHMNGAGAMLVIIFGLIIWTSGYLIESYNTTTGYQNLFNSIGIMGTMVLPPAWLIFSINYTTGNRMVKGWRILPFSIFPVLTAIIVWFPDLRNLIWSSETPVQFDAYHMTLREYGPFFWVIIVHNYLLIAIGAIILLKNMLFGVHVYARQAVSIVIACLIPVLGNALFVFDLLPIMHMDMTPIWFTVSGIILFFSMAKFNLFQVIPIAHRHILQQMKEGILVYDSANRLLEANSVAMNILKLDRRDIGKDIKYLDSVSLITGVLPESNTGNAELPLVVSEEARVFDIESIQMQDSYNHHAGFLVIMRDITSRKLMQEQMMAQDRLASIGELTSGVAHEINNPLAIIKGLVELTLDRDIPEDMREDISLVNDEVDRATGIVRNLLTFACNQTDGKQPLNINHLIVKTHGMRSYEQRQSNIQTDLQLSEHLPKVLGSELQLRQVLVNIIINAEFFIGSTQKEGRITIRSEKRDGHVLITVSDDGPGISKENVSRIFDPFFTTKDVGEGTGLGLSICHGIIAEHGGEIQVRSNEGEGTVFEISLPVFREIR